MSSIVEHNDRYIAAAIQFAEGNRASAVADMRALAEAGFPEGEHFLGWCYELGVEMPRDESLAHFWWMKAANNGVSESMHALALLYRDGRGVERNAVLSYCWCAQAAMAGNVDAQLILSELKSNLSEQEHVAAESRLISGSLTSQ